MAGTLEIPKILSTRCSAKKCGGLLTTQRGFSLVEILVALTILSAVLLPFLSLASSRLAKERENDELIKAIDIAKYRMEETLLQPGIKDKEETIENKFLVKIKILDGDQFDEPDDLRPVEVRVTVFRARDRVKLVELCALK